MYYDIKKAEYVKDYTVKVTFETGETFELDLTPFLRGSVFEPIKEINFFKRFYIDPESETITWPNEADLAPDALYAYAKGNHKFTA